VQLLARVSRGMSVTFDLGETPTPDGGSSVIHFKLRPKRSVELGDVAAFLEQYDGILVTQSERHYYCPVQCLKPHFLSVLAVIGAQMDWFG